jgi:cell filamentation protein
VPGYTFPDGKTLKNKIGAKSLAELERLESDYVVFRRIEIELGLGPRGKFDADHLKALHRHLFQDVFEWAGHTRDQRVQLADGSLATEPILRKVAGKDFLIGPGIPSALDLIAKTLRDAEYLSGLPRDKFAERAADVMSELNAIHPFREGNGRTQRAFISELARQAGHSLDFTVVSRERMVQASIAAHEHDDLSMMRRVFREIGSSLRVDALREAIEFLDHQKFGWNDHYIATTEPGYPVELTMAGFQSGYFMAHTGSQILIGTSSDLPEPHPERDQTFAFIASEKCWE